MVNSRSKGKRGEREILNIIGEKIGLRLERNLQQSDQGGADCLAIEGWAIEVKRVQKESLTAWWDQAMMQAISASTVDKPRKPMLLWRGNRKPWQAMVLLSTIWQHRIGKEEVCIISLEAAIQIILDNMGGQIAESV